MFLILYICFERITLFLKAVSFWGPYINIFIHKNHKMWVRYKKWSWVWGIWSWFECSNYPRDPPNLWKNQMFFPKALLPQVRVHCSKLQIISRASSNSEKMNTLLMVGKYLLWHNQASKCFSFFFFSFSSFSFYIIYLMVCPQLVCL